MRPVNPFTEMNYGTSVNVTRQQLNALSDEQLSDIGIDRGQIDDVARGMVARMAQPMRRAFVSRRQSLTALLRAYVSA